VLASFPRGGFWWWHGGRHLTGARHLSDLLPWRRGYLPRPPTTIHAAVAFLSPAGGLTLIHGVIFLKTVNSAPDSVKSLSNRPSWSLISFGFYVAPEPAFCIKVVVPPTSYKFVMEIILKLALDLNWIGSQT
jgi:hypothetical protein